MIILSVFRDETFKTLVSKDKEKLYNEFVGILKKEQEESEY